MLTYNAGIIFNTRAEVGLLIVYLLVATMRYSSCGYYF